ncbi:MAG: DUF188 domain-containing protein [Spirochaetaceae bacterium]|nr:MAG: DUF188 domain-containing protein [Spirochaetaceae bacterium]
MRILVDADSMNVRIREIIAKAATRVGIDAHFVSNSPVPLPRGNVSAAIVPDADDELVRVATADDIAVTRDVPLAARLVDIGAVVLNDRGDRWTAENVRERLSYRDFAKELRDSGIMSERSRSFGPREIQGFANALDRELARRADSVGDYDQIG